MTPDTEQANGQLEHDKPEASPDLKVFAPPSAASDNVPKQHKSHKPASFYGRVKELAASDTFAVWDGTIDAVAKAFRAAAWVRDDRVFIFGFDDLGWCIGASPKTAAKAARKLVDFGLVKIIRRGVPGERGTASGVATTWQWLGSLREIKS